VQDPVNWSSAVIPAQAGIQKIQTNQEISMSIDLTAQNESHTDDLIPINFGGKITQEFSKEKIYAMNNHRWAYYCWKRFFSPETYESIALIHVDFHQDAIPNEYGVEELPGRDENEILRFTNKYLKWDNFIHPFLYEYQRKINYTSLCHESCRAYAFDLKYVPNLRSIFNAYKKEDFFKLIKEIKSDAIILDLDLDYFVDTDPNGRRKSWETPRVQEFMGELMASFGKRRPNITTIATSPSCLDSGTEDEEKIFQANRLLEAVKPYLLAQ